MIDSRELYINWSEINEIKMRMMEYLTLGETICRDDMLSMDYPKELLDNIRNNISFQISSANYFISKTENILIELKILEDECIKKWNETNLTKEGTEESCQEQNVS